MEPNHEKFMYKNKVMKKLTVKYFIVLTSLALLMLTNSNLVAQAGTLRFIPSDKEKRHCEIKLKKFPFAFDINTSKFYTYNSSNQSRESESAKPQEVIKSSTLLEKLLEGCRCKKYITTRGVFGVETTDIKRSSWAKNFLNNTCEYIQEVRNMELQREATTSIEFCTITSDQLTIAGLPITIETFKNIDITSDCKLDTNNREKCLSKRYEIQTKCKATKNPDAIFHGIKCTDAAIIQCVGDNQEPEILDFLDGFTSDSLNIDTVLKTNDQKGFQKIQDQGAGANNPAINLLLFIINTLANLSFLISVFMLIMAGFYTVIASGNTEMNNKAKAAIKYFVMAVCFTLLSYSIVTIIKALIYS